MSDATPPVAAPPTQEDPRSERLDLIIAALLGVVAVITAIATYLSVLEDGDTLAKFNEGIRATNEAGQFYDQANQKYVSDSNLFLEYAKENYSGDPDLAEYLRTTLFSPELEEGVAWFEEQPDDSDTLSPFDEGSPYALAEQAEAERLDQVSAKAFKEANKHDEDGDKYVLATVVLALALFLLGIAAVRKRYRTQLLLVGIASVISIAAAVQIVLVAA